MTQTSNTYAEALFELASESGKTHEYCKELEKVSAAFLENPDYVCFLDAPSIPVAERRAALKDAFGEVLGEHTLSFLYILCEKGIVHTFQSIYTELKEMVRCADGIELCKVTSAVALTAKEEKELLKLLEKRLSKKVEIKFEVNPQTIGGIIIEADGMVYDGSLRRKLIEMKDVIKK